VTLGAGLSEGAWEGLSLGETDTVGAFVGSLVGMLVGGAEGRRLGTCERVGAKEGSPLG